MHCYTFTSSVISDSIAGEGYEGSIHQGVTIKNGKAYFSNDSYVSLPPGVTGSYKVITIEMWADLPSILGTAESAPLFLLGNSSSFLFCTHSQLEGKINCSFCISPSICSTMTSIDSYSSISIHLVATFDWISGSMTLFLNSLWQCSTSLRFLLPDSLSPSFKFLIGGPVTPSHTRPFLGSVDEFRVWAGPLPPSTITSHFENGPQDMGNLL